MKWWYLPKDDKFFHYCSNYEECLEHIISECRFDIKKHSVSNYYIYNDNGLYNIIKGSEIDPLSICRASNNWDNSGIYLSEREDTFEKEILRLKKIVHGQYKRSSEQLIEIKNKINIIEGNSLEEDLIMMNENTLIKEYVVKYDIGNILVPYVNHIFENRIKNTRDMNEIAKMIMTNYDTDNLTEEHSFVVAYNNNKILGVYILSKGTDSSCPVSTRMIFKFLLLIGANSFVILHNHPNGTLDASDNDLFVTRKINEASDFMDMEFIEHLILADGSFYGIKKDAIKQEKIYFN